MNRNTSILPHSWALNCILFLIVLTFLLLRFVNLNADFPLGITGSGVLYTDEGWYANAAVRHYIFGNWYLAGDFNPVINMPLGQVLHRFTFSIFGHSLSSVRITVAVFFIFLVVLTAWFVRQRFGGFAAMLTALLLTTNYVVFAFSRFATMEFVATFFVVSGLLMAGYLKVEGGGLVRLLLASVLIGAGILTKSTMVFAVPLLAYLAWRHGRSRWECFAFLFVSVIVTLCIVGSYYISVRILFPEDYAYFAQLNFEARMHKSFAEWFLNVPRVVVKVKALGISFVGLAVLTGTVTLIVSQQYRRHPIIHVLIGYIALYVALLSLVSYGPPRYYLPLIVPIAVLFATASIELRQWIYKTQRSSFFILPTLPIILVFGISLGGSGKIIAYLSDPKFTFSQMTHDVGDIIQEREGKVSGVVLFGHIADSVAIEIGTRSINTRLGARTLNWKLRKYHPKYLLLHTDKAEVLKAVNSARGHVTKLASWNVYGNYYDNGQQVYLMHVRWYREAAKVQQSRTARQQKSPLVPRSAFCCQ